MRQQYGSERWNFDGIESLDAAKENRAGEEYPREKSLSEEGAADNGADGREGQNPEAGIQLGASGQTAVKRLKNCRNQEETENRKKKISVLEAEKMENGRTLNGGQGKEQADEENQKEEQIRETGQLELSEGRRGNHIHLLSIIGEIEGHENLSGNTKTTKYEHILPKLAEIEDSTDVDGMLVLINTVGGDVSCGLALAEMVSSLSKPTVSLVIGDSHSIGVPLAVATDYSFIVPTGTMMVHPVRMTGMVIGAAQTYDYFEMIQDRILNFVSSHCDIAYDHLRDLMLNTEMMTRDLGTVLVGKEAVKEGLINEVGGIKEALKKLNSMIEENKK